MRGKKIVKRRKRTLPIERPESARWLLEKRVSAGYTQVELAARLGVHVSSVINWENKGIPTTGTTRRMVEAELGELEEADKDYVVTARDQVRRPGSKKS